MNLSKDDIIYELHRLQMTFKGLERIITDSSRDIEKLIQNMVPNKMRHIEEQIENENPDLSLNEDEEICDLVASLNSSNVLRTPKLMYNSSAELEKYSRPQPVLRDSRSMNNLQNISIPLTNSNSNSKSSISKFSTAINRKKVSNSSKRQHQSSAMLPESRNLKENSINLDRTHSKSKLNIYYSLDQCFSQKSTDQKKETRKELSHLSNLSLFSHNHDIKIIHIRDTYGNNESAKSDLINLCTAKIRIRGDQEPRYVTGLVYIIKESPSILKMNQIDDITDFQAVSADYVTNRPENKYAFLLCQNKLAFTNFIQTSKEQIAQFLTEYFMNEKRFIFHPVLMKDSGIFELSAELRCDEGSPQHEMRQEFKSETAEGNRISQKTLTIHTNKITNNISSARMVCLNQNSKVDPNYFRNNSEMNQNTNMMLGNNFNHRNLNNFDAREFNPVFRAAKENTFFIPNPLNNNFGFNIQNYHNNNYPIPTENFHPNNYINNSWIGNNNQVGNYPNNYPNFNNIDIDY